VRLPRLVLALLCILLGGCATPDWEIREEGLKLVLVSPDGRCRTHVPDGLQGYPGSSDSAEFCGAVPKRGGWFQMAGRPGFARMPDVLRVVAYEPKEARKELGFDPQVELVTRELAERWIAKKKEKLSRGESIRPDPPVIEDLVIERATIAGAPASRLHWKEREPSGLRIEYLAYIVRLDERIFVFERVAPALVYFERFVPHFEQLVAGFEVVPL